MRVLFMGTTPFSNVVLQTLIDEGYELVGVVTQPDRPFGRKKLLKAPVVKEKALEYHIPVFQPEKVKVIYEQLKDLDLDLIVTCAYGQIVPKSILDLPKRRALNVHASLLPKYRGGAPIHWSIIRGESHTGVTLMRMDPKMDAGPYLAMETVEILKDDIMSDVESKLMDASVKLIQNGLREYLDGNLDFVDQDESLVTFAWAIQPKDELIDFNQPMMTVYNHIRGLISWPTSYALLEGKRIKFHGIAYCDLKSTEPSGKIIEIRPEGIFVATADGGVVQLTVIQKEGEAKSRMIDIFNGHAQAWKGKIFNE